MRDTGSAVRAGDMPGYAGNKKGALRLGVVKCVPSSPTTVARDIVGGGSCSLLVPRGASYNESAFS